MPLALWCLIFNLYLPHQSAAQCRLEINGSVEDKHHKEKLSFALIKIKENGRYTYSDSLGNFTINELCPGEITLICYHFDCDTIFLKVNLLKNETIVFKPEHHSKQLDEVGIYGRSDNDNRLKAKHELKGLDFESTKGKSLGNALKSITGVNTLSTGNSIVKPVIHGLHSNRILILNNGVRQEGQQWGNEHAPEIDPLIANKISVIKGANSVRYGSDAIGGVILVEAPLLPDTSGLSGEFNTIGFTNGRGGVVSSMIQQRFRKKGWNALSWRLQGTLKKSGNIKTPDYYMSNTGVEEYNFSYAIGLKKEIFEIEIFYSQFNSSIGIFKGAHIGNVTDLLNAIENEKPAVISDFSYQIDRPYQHIEHELFKVKGRVATGLLGNLHFMYARQFNARNEFDKDKPYNDSLSELNLPELDFRLTTHLSEIYWEHINVNGFVGKIGVSGQTQGNTYRGRFFIPNFRNYSLGSFYIERFVKEKYELETGIRYDYKSIEVFMYDQNILVSPEHVFKRFSWNSGLLLKHNEQSQTLINLSSAWRAPGVNELYSNGLHHGSATVEIGNNTLKTERSLNFIVNWIIQKKNYSFEIEPYVNYFRNFINLEPVQPPTVTIRGAFPTYKFKQVDALFKGIDLRLEHQLFKDWTMVYKYSIVRAKDLTNSLWLFGVPSDKFDAELKYQRNNKKTLKNFYCSTSFTYINKQFRVPPGIDYMVPPKAYSLFGVSAGNSIRIQKNELLIGFDIDNLFNQKYRDFMNRFRYFTDESGRNISLRLTLKF